MGDIPLLRLIAREPPTSNASGQDGKQKQPAEELHRIAERNSDKQSAVEEFRAMAGVVSETVGRGVCQQRGAASPHTPAPPPAGSPEPSGRK
jgi:hypothetical protein